MHKITFAKIYQGNISKCASLFYTKRLWFQSPILGQTCLLAHRRWGIDVSRNVPQRRWARRNVCFRRLIPGKTDWSYLPFLADRMREVFSRREASWKWSSVQGLQNNGLLAFNKFKADVLSPTFSFFTGKLISLVRVMVKITRTLYASHTRLLSRHKTDENLRSQERRLWPRQNFFLKFLINYNLLVFYTKVAKTDALYKWSVTQSLTELTLQLLIYTANDWL